MNVVLRCKQLLVMLYTSRESRVVVISLRAFRRDSCQLKNHESSRMTRVAGERLARVLAMKADAPQTLVTPHVCPSLQNRGSSPTGIGRTTLNPSARLSVRGTRGDHALSHQLDGSCPGPLRTADVSPSTHAVSPSKLERTATNAATSTARRSLGSLSTPQILSRLCPFSRRTVDHGESH